MKNVLHLLIAVSFFLLHNTSSSNAKGFKSYENTDFNYKIIIPTGWKNKVQNKKSKHTMQVIKDHNTTIEIEAFSTPDDINNIIRKKNWDLRNVKSRFRKIIETEKLSINKDTVGKLLVFEYIFKRCNFLHRAIVAKNNGMIYIINCKSPTWYFYRVEDIFTTALASFSPLSKGKMSEPEETVITEKKDEANDGIKAKEKTEENDELEMDDEDMDDLDLEEEL